jgi:hypothetical protein
MRWSRRASHRADRGSRCLAGADEPAKASELIDRSGCAECLPARRRAAAVRARSRTLWRLSHRVRLARYVAEVDVNPCSCDRMARSRLMRCGPQGGRAPGTQGG